MSFDTQSAGARTGRAANADGGCAAGASGAEAAPEAAGCPRASASACAPGAEPWRRIAVCAAGELFGGVERHLVDMVGALSARGVSALPILFHDAELARRLRAQGVEPVILPSSNRATPVAAGRLASLLARHRIALVHAHGYKAVVVCALARLRRRFALVKTEHGLPEPGVGRLPRARLYAGLDALATRAAGATVCYVTRDLQARCRHAHAGLRTEVVPNGACLPDQDRLARPPEYAPDMFNLVLVGRLSPVKGQAVAIEALATRQACARWRLHLVGTGPLEPALRALAAARGVADQVRFAGFRRDVYDHVAHADLMLMPSLHEGLPYALLEAMALGTPVVASGVGGIAETVRHDDTALLVPPGDPEALAQAVGELHRDAPRRARLGAQARRLQAEAYSLEAMADRYLQIYLELAGPARAVPQAPAADCASRRGAGARGTGSP